MKCRLCSSDNVKSVLSLERVPANVQAMLTQDQLGQVSAVKFEVFQCEQCGLVQAPLQLNSQYYDDYLMSTTFSTQLADYLDGLVEEFTTTYQLSQGRVLDVGAGDGAFMYPFRRRGIAVVGIEPSERSRAVALAAGFDVHPGYVTPDTVIDGAPFDAFVSRQVLEHVNDISGFLAGIKRNLKPGAVGIIEVPRLEKALADSRFYDFFPDHVNYFSLDTLRRACEINGFEVLEQRATMFDEYNVVVVRARSATDMTQLQQDRVSLVDQFNSVLARYKQQGAVTAVWGSGAKGLSIMTNVDVGAIDHLIDSDVNKQGRYTAVSELLVESTDILQSQHIDVVVITAVAYQTAILKKLREHYGYSGDVYVLDNNGLRQL